MFMNISYINMCNLEKNREWREAWYRERGVSGDDVCDCSLGELLYNKKPFRPLYVIKHVLNNIYVIMCCLFKWIRICAFLFLFSFYCFLIPVLPSVQFLKEKIRMIQLMGLTSPYFCTCHTPGLDFSKQT